MKKSILIVENLAISFKTGNGILRAVRDISFNLYEGETLAIIGESGSGKSVSSRAIMGLLAANAVIESGTITFDGQDILKADESALNRIRGKRISMVFQDSSLSLNPIVKVGKQIVEAIMVNSSRKLTRADAKKRAIELMEEVGIVDAEHRYNWYPFEFSGGMRQRIVIAIALSSRPQVLICDEPTTALDVTIQAKILELINSIKSSRNLSIIFITHDLGVVAKMADRVAVMYAGKIVEYGRVEQIFYNPKHPYTWALLASMPNLYTSQKIDGIKGTPPNMLQPIIGDAFAPRNEYALKYDYLEHPPFFKVEDGHFVASWLAHPSAPKVDIPENLRRLLEQMKNLREDKFGE